MKHRYDALKKYIYQLEKHQDDLTGSTYRDLGDLEANERSALINGTNSNSGSDAVFVPLLDKELKKIELFYKHQEKEILDEIRELQDLIKQQEDLWLSGGNYYMDDDGIPEEDEDEDEDEDGALSRSETLSRGKRQKSTSSMCWHFLHTTRSLI